MSSGIAGAEPLRLFFEAEQRWRKWQGTPPQSVYHYTRAASLPKILESKRLWATSTSDLNDARELEHASDLLRDVLRDRAKRSRTNGDLYRPTVTNFRYPRSDLLTTFVASLSGAEDDLSQWSMYGDAFAGVALGFDSSVLIALDAREPTRQPVGFFRVLYHEKEQRQFFEWLVDRWEALVSEKWQLPDRSAMDAKMRKVELESQLAIAALSVLPRMKDRHFASENEWRIAHLHNRHRSDCDAFSIGDRTHVALDLAQIAGAMPLVSIWLGPAVANDESEDLLKRLLMQHDRQNVDIRRSEIPLRGEPKRLILNEPPNSR